MKLNRTVSAKGEVKFNANAENSIAWTYAFICGALHREEKKTFKLTPSVKKHFLELKEEIEKQYPEEMI